VSLVTKQKFYMLVFSINESFKASGVSVKLMGIKFDKFKMIIIILMHFIFVLAIFFECVETCRSRLHFHETFIQNLEYWIINF